MYKATKFMVDSVSTNGGYVWLMTSNPYIGDGQNKEQTDEYASTNVGDKTEHLPTGI